MARIALHRLPPNVLRYLDDGFHRHPTFHQSVAGACTHLIRLGYTDSDIAAFLADGTTPFHHAFETWCRTGSGGKGKGSTVTQAAAKCRAARRKVDHHDRAVTRWLTTVLGAWAEPRADVPLRVLVAIADTALHSGTTSPTMSLLQIAETAGVGSTTNPLRSTTPIVKALGRLERMGLIRRDHSGRSGAAFKNATRIHLNVHPDAIRSGAPSGRTDQKREMGGTSGTKYSCTNPPGVIGTGSPPHGLWVAPVSIPELLHPLWEAHAGLGMNACAVWSIVRKHRFITSTQIAERTGRHASQIRKLLQRLERHGLVTSSPDHQWQIIAATIQDLDVAAEGLGLTMQREKRRAINVARRANYSQVLEIRRAAWAAAQRVDWEWARFIDPLTGELLGNPFPSDLGQRSALGGLTVTSGSRNGPQLTT